MNNRRHYRIAIVAPFPPLQGGMVQLAVGLADGFEKDGHKVLRVNLGTGKAGIVKLPFLYLQFIRAAFRSDIVQTISASGLALWTKDMPALLSARLLGKKAVLNFVGGMAVEKASSWGWWKRLPFYLASVVVVPTKLFRDAIVQEGLKTEFKIIPHIVDPEPFSVKKNRANAPVLLAAKGLESYANVDILLDIFSNVQKQVPNAEFWIAGDGPERDKLEAIVTKNNIQGVQFLGAVPHEEMPAIMSQASIFVHGTRYESFGIALVEAMAAGLPIVAFAVGGIPEIVIDEETGFLVPYGDKDKFCEKVVYLLENQAEQNQMSDKCRQHSTAFGWGKISQKWYSLFDYLL